VFKIVPDRNTVVTQLETHEIDLWMPVSAPFYRSGKGDSGLDGLAPAVVLLQPPRLSEHAPGFRRSARAARLALAIDRNELKLKIRHGIGIVQDDPVSPKHPTFDRSVPTDPSI